MARAESTQATRYDLREAGRMKTGQKREKGFEELVFDFQIEQFINLDELAKLLPVTKSWVYKMTSTNSIPFHKFSGKLNFSKSDIEGIIKFCERNPAGPHNEAA